MDTMKYILTDIRHLYFTTDKTLDGYLIVKYNILLTRCARSLDVRELSKHDVDGARTSSENVTVRVSAIIFQLFKVIMLEKCVLTILELNWNQRFRDKKTKLNMCHHMLTLSTQLQSRSFYVEERTRTSSKRQKMKNARAKRAKIPVFIVKYANLWGFCCRRRRGCHFDFLLL